MHQSSCIPRERCEINCPQYKWTYTRVCGSCVFCDSLLLSVCISLYADDICLFLLCPLHVAFVMSLLHCTTSAPPPIPPPIRLQPSTQREWQTELQAEEVSTTNSLKHTTDIKDDEWRKTWRRGVLGRAEGRVGESATKHW